MGLGGVAAAEKFAVDAAEFTPANAPDLAASNFAPAYGNFHRSTDRSTDKLTYWPVVGE